MPCSIGPNVVHVHGICGMKIVSSCAVFKKIPLSWPEAGTKKYIFSAVMRSVSP